jgi:hypothetical protein
VLDAGLHLLLMSNYGRFEYGDDVSDRDDVVRGLLEGRTIVGVDFPAIQDQTMVLRLDDGSAVTLSSWDYEGYSSGFYVFPGEP